MPEDLSARLSVVLREGQLLCFYQQLTNHLRESFEVVEYTTNISMKG